MEKVLEQILLELQNLRDGQKQLTEMVNKVDSKIETVDRNVEHLKDSIIQGLGAYFENIERHIDKRADELTGVLQRQQGTIEVLSSRSIEQEAETKALKRAIQKH